MRMWRRWNVSSSSRSWTSGCVRSRNLQRHSCNRPTSAHRTARKGQFSGMAVQKRISWFRVIVWTTLTFMNRLKDIHDREVSDLLKKLAEEKKLEAVTLKQKAGNKSEYDRCSCEWRQASYHSEWGGSLLNLCYLLLGSNAKQPQDTSLLVFRNGRRFERNFQMF